MQTISIGRDPSNNIVLNDNYVSRKHAQLILLDNGQVLIKDLGSSNGTFVNGNRITGVYLKTGDVVKCAGMIFNWSQYVNSSVYKQPKKQTAFERDQFQMLPEKSDHQVLSDSEQYQTVQQPQSNQPASSLHQQNIVIIGKQKSVGTAFVLALFFGPLGLFYASVVGGAIMFFLAILSWIILPIVGYFFIIVPACVVWAVIAANIANNKIMNPSAPLIQNQFANK